MLEDIINLHNINFYYLFYCFIIYSVLGWALEVIYHVFTLKKFINRGFLNGPLCPVYGVTAVSMIVCLVPLQNNFALIFIGGFIVSSLIEFITGYLLELIFHTRWWDYSNEKFNIAGYICLKFSIYWSAISIIFIKGLHPFVNNIIEHISSITGEVLYNILMILLVADITVTIIHLIEFRKLIRELHEISDEIRVNLENIKTRVLTRAKEIHIENRNLYLKNDYERLISNMKFKHRFFIKAYPNITSKRFGRVIRELKERFNYNSEGKSSSSIRGR